MTIELEKWYVIGQVLKEMSFAGQPALEVTTTEVKRVAAGWLCRDLCVEKRKGIKIGTGDGNILYTSDPKGLLHKFIEPLVEANGGVDPEGPDFEDYTAELPLGAQT